jgi:hypothetical protein
MDNMQSVKMASNYKFSAVKVDQLQASRYTLVTVATDMSGSVSGFSAELTNCLKTILGSCQKSPMVDNLMLRLIGFNSGLTELHGFKMLADIKPSDYDNIVQACGNTALYDAVYTSIEATRDYGGMLSDQDYMANAIIFVLTDGMDNSSTYSPGDIRKLIDKTMLDESLESVIVVLVGVNSNAQDIKQYLETLKNEAKITQFIDIGEATPSKLAKLANFISQSISSTSQALGSGSASSLLTF